MYSGYLILFTKAHDQKNNREENRFVASESEGNSITVRSVVVVVDVTVVVDITEVSRTVN